MKVDFPAPFGPSTATNLPASMVVDTSCQTRRPRRVTPPPVMTTAGAVSAAGGSSTRRLVQGPPEGTELGDLPLLEGGTGGKSVSVMGTTGMLLARALATRRWTSGVEFCELTTKTSSSWRASCRSTVALSAAVTSLPSLIASRKRVGVTRRSPVACATPSKMLSDAPTGVPA